MGEGWAKDGRRMSEGAIVKEFSFLCVSDPHIWEGIFRL